MGLSGPSPPTPARMRQRRDNATTPPMQQRRRPDNITRQKPHCRAAAAVPTSTSCCASPLPSQPPPPPSPQVDCQVPPLQHQRACANAVTTPPPHQRADADDPTTSPSKSPTVALPPSQRRPNADAPPPSHQHCRQFPVNAKPPTPCQRQLARAERRERSKRCCPPPQLCPGPPMTWAEQREHRYPPHLHPGPGVRSAI